MRTERRNCKGFTTKDWESTYCGRTPRSKACYERAVSVFPGGDTRTVTYFPPYPLFMKEGTGCGITDVDGNAYLDLVNNYTSLIHGHARQEVVDAILDQAPKGLGFASPLELQVELARLLCLRIPSLKQVRFCNSGTEATLAAIRAAKAFTGRNKILKMEGGYHGSHDAAEISVAPSLDEAGLPEAPTPRVECAGLFRGILTDVLVAPFNHIDAVRRMITTYGDDLAAIIVEPILGAGGTIPAEPDFLKFLRIATADCGALLIFDEIISFRISFGGAQESYCVQPDLTTLGKIIGGGLPVGAFGGRADVMALFDPRRGQLSHSGTFNGNALTMAAGIATLQLLTRKEIARLNKLGNQLRDQLRKSFSDIGLPGQVTGSGSLAAWHFTDSVVMDYRGAAAANRSLHHPIHLSLLNKGMFTMPRGAICLSTAMGTEDVDLFAESFQESLKEVANLVETVSRV